MRDGNGVLIGCSRIIDVVRIVGDGDCPETGPVFNLAVVAGDIEVILVIDESRRDDSRFHPALVASYFEVFFVGFHVAVGFSVFEQGDESGEKPQLLISEKIRRKIRPRCGRRIVDVCY